MSSPLITWFSFGVILIASDSFGRILAPFVPIPQISLYLLLGVACNPFALGLLGPGSTLTLANVSRVCLSFICITAGAEMRVATLRPLIRIILAGILAILVFVFAATFSFTLAVSEPAAALLPSSLSRQSPACRAGIAAIMASISLSFAPAASIAVIREMRAWGPFTSRMLGILILSNVVTLLAFAVSRNLAEAACADGSPLRGEELAVSISMIPASLLLGCVLGVILVLVLRARSPATPLLILALGGSVFIGAEELRLWSEANMSYTVAFEPLLVCIMGGAVAINFSANAELLAQSLESTRAYVFVPFFTLQGLGLDLSSLANSALFSFLFALLRGLGLTAAFGAVAVSARIPLKQILLTAPALITQAGVAFGLAGEVGLRFKVWGKEAQAAIVTSTLVALFVGPSTLAWALQKVGEAGAEEEVGPVGKGRALGRSAVLVVGTSEAIAVAAVGRLRQGGAAVTLVGPSDAARDWRARQVDETSAALVAAAKAVGALEKKPFARYPTPLPPLSTEALEGCDDVLCGGPGYLGGTGSSGEGGLSLLHAATETRLLVARLGQVVERLGGRGGGGKGSPHHPPPPSSSSSFSQLKTSLVHLAGEAHRLLLQPVPLLSPPPPFSGTLIALPREEAAFSVLEVLLRLRSGALKRGDDGVVRGLSRVVVHVGCGAWGRLMQETGAAVGVEVLVVKVDEAAPLLAATALLVQGVGGWEGGAVEREREGEGKGGSHLRPLAPPPPEGLVELAAALRGQNERGVGGGDAEVVVNSPVHQRQGWAAEWR